MTALIELEEVALEYGGRPVLDGLSLSLARGQILALAGPSGSGKTSLLRLVLGLERPSRGTVRLRGRVASAAGRLLVPPHERGLAVVFQDLALWPHLSVAGNLQFVLMARGVAPGAIGARVSATLTAVGLAGYEKRRPGTLSGGEQQRVAIARALVTDPDLVLFDEPLAHLDVALRADMLALIRRLLAERQAAALFVTHDAHEARELGASVAVLDAGRIARRGSLADLADAPAGSFARAFADS